MTELSAISHRPDLGLSALSANAAYPHFSPYGIAGAVVVSKNGYSPREQTPEKEAL